MLLTPARARPKVWSIGCQPFVRSAGPRQHDHQRPSRQGRGDGAPQHCPSHARAWMSTLTHRNRALPFGSSSNPRDAIGPESRQGHPGPRATTETARTRRSTGQPGAQDAHGINAAIIQVARRTCSPAITALLSASSQSSPVPPAKASFASNRAIVGRRRSIRSTIGFPRFPIPRGGRSLRGPAQF